MSDFHVWWAKYSDEEVLGGVELYAEDAWETGREAAIEACAAEAAAAGCICLALNSAEAYEDEFPGKGFKCAAQINFHLPAEQMVTEHDPRCPKALAARLRGLA